MNAGDRGEAMRRLRILVGPERRLELRSTDASIVVTTWEPEVVTGLAAAHRIAFGHPEARARKLALGLGLRELLGAPGRWLTAHGIPGAELVIEGHGHDRAAVDFIDLPWELLGDGVEHVVDRSPLRVLRSSSGASERPTTGRRRRVVLYLGACPIATEALDLEAEEDMLQSACVPVVPLGIGTLAGLAVGVRDVTPVAVHLCCHGDPRRPGRLLFETRTGAAESVTVDRLVDALAPGRPPALVFVSGCGSGAATGDDPSLAARLAVALGTTVIAWGATVHDNTARNAASVLYRQLASGCSPLTAISRTMSALRSGATGSRDQREEWHLLRIFGRPADVGRPTWPGGARPVAADRPGVHVVGRRWVIRDVLHRVEDAQERGERMSIALNGPPGIGTTAVVERIRGILTARRADGDAPTSEVVERGEDDGAARLGPLDEAGTLQMTRALLGRGARSPGLREVARRVHAACLGLPALQARVLTALVDRPEMLDDLLTATRSWLAGTSELPPALEMRGARPGRWLVPLPGSPDAGRLAAAIAYLGLAWTHDELERLATAIAAERGLRRLAELTASGVVVPLDRPLTEERRHVVAPGAALRALARWPPDVNTGRAILAATSATLALDPTDQVALSLTRAALLARDDAVARRFGARALRHLRDTDRVREGSELATRLLAPFADGGPPPAELRYYGAELLVRSGDIAGARELLDALHDPVAVPEPELRGGALIMEARIAADQGRDDDALELVGQARIILRGLRYSSEQVIADCIAADVHRRRGAMPEAERMLVEIEGRWQALGDHAGIAHVLGKRAELCWITGRMTEALTLTERRLELYEALGDADGLAVALNAAGRMRAVLDQPGAALALHHRALAIHRDLGNRGGYASTQCLLARALQRSDPPRAAALLDDAIVTLRTLGDPAALASALRDLAEHRFFERRYEDAITAIGDSIAALAGMQDPRAEAISYRLLGRIHLNRGDEALGIQALRRSRAGFECIGDAREVDITDADIARSELSRGHIDAAIATFTRLLQSSESLGDIASAASIRNNLATALMRAGRRREAAELYELAAAQHGRIGETTFQLQVLGNLARCLEEMGEIPRAAEIHAARLAALEAPTADLREQAIARGDHARMLAMSGDHAAARDEYTQQIAELDKMEERPQAAASRLELAEVLEATGDFDAAVRVLCEAEEAFLAAGRTRQGLRAAAHRARIHRRQGGGVEISAESEAACEALAAEGDLQRSADSLRELGRIELELAAHEAADRLFEAARRRYERAGDPREAAITVADLGRVALARGAFEESARRGIEAAGALLAADDRRSAYVALGNASFSLERGGAPLRAAELELRRVALAEALDEPLTAADCKFEAARLLVRGGEDEAAIPLLRACFAANHEHGRLLAAASTALFLGQLLFNAENPVEGVALVTEARDAFRTGGAAEGLAAAERVLKHLSALARGPRS